MNILSKFALLSFSLILLAGCESTGGSASSSTASYGGWQGWTSVLKILESSMVSDDGRQLASMQDFQTRLITPQGSTASQALPSEVSDELDANASSETVTPVATTVGATSGTIEVTLFARGQMHAVRIKNVPLNGRGVPTAASAGQIKKAAISFKNQIFGPNAKVTEPTMTEDQIIDQLLSQ